MNNKDIVIRLIELDIIRANKYNAADDIGIDMDKFLGDLDFLPLIKDIVGHPLPILAEWIESYRDGETNLDEVIEWIFDKEINNELVEKHG